MHMAALRSSQQVVPRANEGGRGPKRRHAALVSRISAQQARRSFRARGSPVSACLDCLVTDAVSRVARHRLVARPAGANHPGGGAARLSVLACASDRGEGRQDASPQGPGQQGERGDDEQPVVATREGEPAAAAPPSEPDGETVLVALALALLRFYKREISPLLPMSCRFVPTCSEYAMSSFKKFGALKGLILTLWRLVRCSPIGPSGYDPPVWPPKWKAG